MNLLSNPNISYRKGWYIGGASPIGTEAGGPRYSEAEDMI